MDREGEGGLCILLSLVVTVTASPALTFLPKIIVEENLFFSKKVRCASAGPDLPADVGKRSRVGNLGEAVS
jgi:hypothetical protein